MIILTEKHYEDWADYVLNGIQGAIKPLGFDYRDPDFSSSIICDNDISEMIEAAVVFLQCDDSLSASVIRADYGLFKGGHISDSQKSKAQICGCSVRAYRYRLSKSKAFIQAKVTELKG